MAMITGFAAHTQGAGWQKHRYKPQVQKVSNDFPCFFLYCVCLKHVICKEKHAALRRHITTILFPEGLEGQSGQLDLRI